MPTDYAYLRKNIPILEVAGRLGIQVTRNKARCFYPERHSHGDRTPSLSFHPASNTFKCFVCPEVKGSVIDLVMHALKIDFKNAVDWLKTDGHEVGARHGEPLPHVSLISSTPFFNYLFDLCGSISDEGLRYLKGRRIFRKTALKMQLRTIDDYAAVSESLKGRFTTDELKSSGLFNEKEHFRFYKHTLLIPYLKGNEVHYFQARAMDPDARPKELNPSGPIPFPYNIHGVAGNDIIYLCEGAIDTLTLIENGFPAAGIPGAMSFKPEWLSFFKGKRVFSVLDADAAGRAGNERLRSLFSGAGIPFSVIDIPEGRDINDIFRR